MVDFRVGFGYDSHRFAPDRPLVIGGIAIPYELGLAAHSDGDVLIHAVCDALLGAAGLKDIGTWFPDTDSTWKNADSTVLLTKVMELMTSRGWQVNNLDCTLVLEKPKMKPYIDDMVTKLSELLQTNPENIAVKAKTNEKMGFTGAGEGIAAVAAVTLRKQ
ncbi:MAG: 2-C-methyl-D-erythritol 2,4-cyclodiphosphate synthase [Bacteroidales bacterium]|nr:2-C-methyl-D-erythritol 2,4-cyclodiphosphate synthase [Bacteroidales bacterium]